MIVREKRVLLQEEFVRLRDAINEVLGRKIKP